MKPKVASRVQRKAYIQWWRSIQELQIQVDQRYQHIQEELNSLSADLEKYMSDKNSALTPPLEVLNKCIPAGALFRVCAGNCSFEVVRSVLESLTLLPFDEGISQIDAGVKVLAKAWTKQADLAEEIYSYALDLGCSAQNSDFKTAANKLRRKTAKQLLLTLPWTATEPQVREVVEQYLQRGAQEREEGNYEKSLKQLERGWNLLQQWGVESASNWERCGLTSVE